MHRRWVRRLMAGLLAVLVVVSSVLIGANATTDRFLVSRVIAWRVGDSDDWQRFPARSIPTGRYRSPFLPPPAQPPPWLRSVTHFEGAPESTDPREPWASDLPPQRGAPVIGPLDGFLAHTGTTAFLVAQDDTLLYERYFQGRNHDSVQRSFSVAKSFVSALIGIAVAEYAIGSVDDTAVSYLPELRGRGLDTITIRQLLTMSSGLKYSGAGVGPPVDDVLSYYSPDLRRLALSVQPDVAPGTRWQYNDYHALLLGMILERTTHRPVATYLSEKLWQPLGMEADGSWSLDSTAAGFELTQAGINARAVDFLRFGRLYLDGGTENGRQLVPRNWVRESTRADTTRDPADFYQHFWWVDVARPGRYMAVGVLGQYIYVVPDKGLVIARFGSDWGYSGWVPLLRSIADAAPPR